MLRLGLNLLRVEQVIALLKLLDRLPVRMLGAVLNDIRAQGEYKYYSYLYGYTTSEDDDLPRTSPQVGELTGRT